MVSVIVGVPLHGTVINDIIGLDDCLVRDGAVCAHSLDGGTVEVYLVVDDQERIIRVHDIVVNGYTVQVLFK